MSKGLILAAGLDPGFQMDIPKQFVIVDNYRIYTAGVSETSGD